jgi:hypothetical protein
VISLPFAVRRLQFAVCSSPFRVRSGERPTANG